MKKEVFQKKLGEKVSQIREKMGITQSELALRCDKDRQSLGRLEKGNINPTAYYLFEIAKELQVPVKELLDFD